MKIAAIAAWCLLFVTPPAGLCSVMVNAPPKKSAQNIQVVALVDGKPRKGAKVEIYRNRGKKGVEADPRFSLVTDDDGKVAPPALPPGEYWIVASAELNLTADLYLRVSSHAKEKISSFSMELVASQFPTWEQQLAAAEQTPVKDRMQAFSGIVRDQSGAAILGVSIDVVRKGTQGKEHATRLKSDKDGRFSADLVAGSYVAFFSAQGFSTQFVPFEVEKTQGSGELRIKLQIAPASE